MTRKIINIIIAILFIYILGTSALYFTTQKDVAHWEAETTKMAKNEANLKNINFATTYEKIYDDDSKALLLKVYDFSSVVEVSSGKKEPHLITNYVYELASMFHNYYGKHRILTEDIASSSQRLSFIKAVAITINNALNLIGVEAPNKM